MEVVAIWFVVTFVVFVIPLFLWKAAKVRGYVEYDALLYNWSGIVFYYVATFALFMWILGETS